MLHLAFSESTSSRMVAPLERLAPGRYTIATPRKPIFSGGLDGSKDGGVHRRNHADGGPVRLHRQMQ
jgi:hypothetical protein